MSFADRVRRRRLQLRLTQEQLAQKITNLGETCSRSTVAFWENPRGKDWYPTPEHLEKLVQALEIDLMELRFGTKEQKVQNQPKDDIFAPQLNVNFAPTVLSLSEITKWLDTKQYILQRGASMTQQEKESTYFMYRMESAAMTSGVRPDKCILEGDICVIDPTATNDIKGGDVVLARQGFTDDRKIRIFHRDGLQCYLSALNPDFPHIKIDDNIRIDGKVIRRITQFN